MPTQANSTISHHETSSYHQYSPFDIVYSTTLHHFSCRLLKMSDTEPFPPLDPGFAQTGQNIPEIRVEEFVEIAESNHQAPLDGSSAGGPVTKNEEGSSEIQADKLDDTADGSRQPRVDLCAIQARQDEREAFIERLIKIAETLLWYCLHLSVWGSNSADH